ncbi:MAG: MFS transporter, partial [Pseudomonadota bacterium]
VSDIVGRRRTILASVTLIGVSMLATPYAQNLTALAVARFVTGLGVGAMLASLAAIASEYLPDRYRSFGVVAITAGYPAGATAGAFVAAPMIAEFGWRSVFFAGGAATLAMLVVVLALIPESLAWLNQHRPPDALGRINAALKAIGKTTVTALPVPAAAPERRGGAQRFLANLLALLAPGRALLTLTVWLTFFFCFIALYFLMSWIPKLVEASGHSLSIGIYTSSTFNLGGVLGMLLLGFLSTRLALTRLIALFVCAAAALMVLFGFLPQTVPVLLVMTAAIGFLLQGGFTGMYAVAAKVYPADIRATGVGWAIGLGRLGAVVGPYLGGLAIDAQFSMATSFALFAIPLAIGGVLAYLLNVR